MPHRPTIVLIAHRTENLSLCDRVIRFEARGLETAAQVSVVASPPERTAIQ